MNKAPKKLYLFETREQCRFWPVDEFRQHSILALTAEAMYALDELGCSYKTPKDYLGLEFFVDVRRTSRIRHASFCHEMDRIIKSKLPDPLADDPCLEPAYWFNKFSCQLVEAPVSFEKLFNAAIASESPDQVVYFDPQQKSEEQSLYYDLIYANALFLSSFLSHLQQDYPTVNFCRICIRANTTMLMPRQYIPFRQRLRNSLPWIILRSVHAMAGKDWSFFAPSSPDQACVLRLGTNHDIRMLADKIADQQGKKVLRKEDLALVIEDRTLSWTKKKFCNKHKNRLFGLAPQSELFTKEDFCRALRSTYPEVSDGVTSFVSERFDRYRNYIVNGVMIYEAASQIMNERKIECVMAHSGTDPFNNAILSAARKQRVRNYIFQHGGDFGESFHYGETEHTCFAFTDHFGLWSKNAKELTKKYVDSRCSFFYVGRTSRQKGQIRKRDTSTIKKVLFVHNNAFHGYHPLMKDCLWFRIYKEISRLFVRYPQFEYMLRPSPKGELRFPALEGHMQASIPGLQIMKEGSFVEVCAQADLVIIDCLSTTLHEALEVNTQVIGLKHPTYVQYYPEVEHKVAGACVFCKTEEDFLTKIEFYLQHPDRFPDLSEGIRQWQEACYECSTDQELYDRFMAYDKTIEARSSRDRADNVLSKVS